MIQEAKSLQTPVWNPLQSHNVRLNDPAWIAAFEWYNENINKGVPLRMTCIPCYPKVLQALKEAKK